MIRLRIEQIKCLHHYNARAKIQTKNETTKEVCKFSSDFLADSEDICIFAEIITIMEIPRQLIYQERWNITDFDINKVGSLNKKLYDEWLLNLADLEPFKSGLSKRRLKVFNDAYYICTLIMMHPTNEEFTHYAYKRCSLPSVVFPLVHFYISNVNDRGYSNSVLLKNIKAGLKSEGTDGNLRELIKCTENIKVNISSSQFVQRKLTPELLANIPWYRATGKFAKEDILKLMRYIPKDKAEWDLMLDAIKNAIKDYEWENNQYLDYIDEKGQWCQDSPIDMTQTIIFCEELKNKYEEESLYYKETSSITDNNNSSPEIIEILPQHTIIKNSKGRPKAKPFEEYLKEDAPEGLMAILEDLLRNKTGKDAARIIIAITNLWIDEPATTSICNKFPCIKPSSYNEAKNKHYGLNEYQNHANPFSESELDNIRTIIRERLQFAG